MAQDSGELEVRRGLRPGDVFVRRRRIPRVGLSRVLGVPGLFSSAYGNVGSSIYYALGVTALFALGFTPAIFVFAGLLFGATALTYAEGASAMPEAGGSSVFARRGFNELVSFIAGWALMLDYIVTIAVSAFFVPNYLGVFLPALKTWPTNALFGIGVVAFLAGLNVLGVRESTGVNISLAVLDLLTQALLVILGVFFLLSIPTLIDNVHWGEAPSWNRLLFGISISMIAYTGIETVSNLSEETRNPGRNVPRSVGLVFVAVLSLFFFISSIALSAMPVLFDPAQGEWVSDVGEKYLNDPVVGVVKHLPEVIEPLLSAWVGILAATILLIATNAGLLGLSRLAYSMGRHRQLPPLVSQIHPRRRTPANAIVLFAIIAALLIIPGKVTLLADLYSFGAMLAFTFAHASIIALRIKEPNMVRPFKVPVNIRLKGRDIPLPALVGGLATFATWVVVIYSHEFGRAVGFAWLAVGIALYLTYRRAIGESPLKTVRLGYPS